MFTEPVPKAPSLFPNVFLLTDCLGVFELVYYPTLLGGSALVFGSHQKGLDGVVTSEMNLYS